MKFVIAITFLLVGQIAFGQDRIKEIDSILNSAYSNGEINGNILIAEKGTIIYNKSFGYANEETKEKLNENSIFELASCSKQFTAMAIMILKETGKLDLDDDITKFIPALSAYKGIRIRNLLNHTSGLPDYMELMDSVFDKTRIATNNDIITIFSKYKPKVLFKPNTKFEYSNTGYALLASIIEQASGLSYADFLSKNIFEPLQMTNSFVYTRRFSPKNVSNYAFGYVYSDSLKKYLLPDELKETKMVVWLDGVVGDGCVNSTVNDLFKWDRALYTNKLLSPEGMKAIFEVATLNDKSKTEYSFGWFVNKNAEFGKIVSHSGGWPGYATYIERHVDSDKTILILLNRDKPLIPLKMIRNILYNKPLPVVKIRKEIALSVEQLQKFLGTYRSEKDFEIKISLEKGQLFIQPQGQNAYPISAESEMRFFVKRVNAQIQFEQNDQGEIEKFLIIFSDGNKMEAVRKK